MKEINGILTIASRDVTKFLRDKPRVVTSFIFPLLFIGILGGSLQSSFGETSGFNLLAFIFTGILAQNIFSSTASGVIYLIRDREDDFAQELFVAPISRYSIILGKIVGESGVSLIHGVGIVIFGLIMGVSFGFGQLLLLIPIGIIASLLGGAFGVLILANLNDYRSASQVFPFLIFPQYFLAGVFAPIKDLPFYLSILSRITPMTYAVDLLRGMYYAGTPEYDKIVLMSPFFNLLIIAGMFTLFIFLGTWLFIRKEKNK